MKTTGVGVVGCGNISGIYFKTCKMMKNIEVVACADLVAEKARAAAEKHGIPKVLTTEQLLADPDVQIVLNLTIPKAHHEVALAAIQAGKHVYTEKPLSVNRAAGRRVIEAAKAKGVRVGGAPDTFLGAGGQTCRKLIDSGAIGRPVAAVSNMMGWGHETWHPDPEFYYKPGGGPMLDMGPYYLTALVNLLGPVQRVTGVTAMSYKERTISSQPKAGQVIKVEVPTYVAGILNFQAGPVVNINTSFDIRAAQLPLIQIYGTEGTLNVPDPNGFGGKPMVWRLSEREWKEVPLEFSYAENSRGLGLADMAAAIESGRPHRASGALTFHVLDIMEAIHDASDQGRHIVLKSQVERPAPMPQGLKEGEVEA
jgi:predicted dehydrogenase